MSGSAFDKSGERRARPPRAGSLRRRPREFVGPHLTGAPADGDGANRRKIGLRGFGAGTGVTVRQGRLEEVEGAGDAGAGGVAGAAVSASIVVSPWDGVAEG